MSLTEHVLKQLGYVKVRDNLRPGDIFPHFTESDFGFSPMKRTDDKGQTLIKCDECGQYKPYTEVSVSPGDGWAECKECFEN